MPLYVQERESDDTYALVAKIDNVKSLYNILKALNFSQEAVCFCSRDGLKFTVELSKCVQASAFVVSDVFQEFSFNEDEQLIFKVDFHTLIEYVNMLEASGMSTTVDLRIQGHGHPLLMLGVYHVLHRLEEDGVILDCQIRTQEPGEIADFSFAPDVTPNKIILKSDFLKEIFDELDATSEFIGIEISKQHVTFTTLSHLIQSEHQIDKMSDMIEYFDCRVRTAFRYRFEHLKHTIRALAVSQKVSLRMDSTGLLCFQCMIKIDDAPMCFVEYFCIQSTNDDGRDMDDPVDEFTLPEAF